MIYSSWITLLMSAWVLNMFSVSSRLWRSVLKTQMCFCVQQRRALGALCCYLQEQVWARLPGIWHRTFRWRSGSATHFAAPETQTLAVLQEFLWSILCTLNIKSVISKNVEMTVNCQKQLQITDDLFFRRQIKHTNPRKQSASHTHTHTQRNSALQWKCCVLQR